MLQKTIAALFAGMEAQPPEFKPADVMDAFRKVDRILESAFLPSHVDTAERMFGNMLKVSGVCDSLSNAAQNELSNLVTLFLGITVGATMTAENILTFDVLKILALGAVAFVFDTVGGVLFAKIANLFLKKKINPMIGACGISAFPMSGRVIAKMALKEDPTNYIIQHAMGVNVAGQVASVVAGGLVLALIPVLG